VDRLLDKATRAGAKVLRRPSDTPSGGHTACFSDPDGYLWQIAARP
jgi:predicted enzyme related to lactoylglutathione lyase